VSCPVTITRLDDPRIEVFRDVRDRDLRGRRGIFMAESEMVVRRLLRTPGQLHSLLLSPSKHGRLADAIKCLPDDVGVYVADLDVIEGIAGFHIHRGVLAAGWRPTEQDVAIDRLLERVEPIGPRVILAAAGINNSDNMGGLFRTAAAFGVDHLLFGDDCCDPLYRKSVRVSMGHVLSVPWAMCEDLPTALRLLRDQHGFQVIAAESGEGAASLDACTFADRVIIVVGAEGHGLSQEVLRCADHIAEIPMAHGVPSLNVVVAAGIFLNGVRRFAAI
jgi:tRNA G18 (ribose-2'-O)-methylase SpoU